VRIRKAVITAAAGGQRDLPVQTLVDQEGNSCSVLHLVIEEILRARIEEIGVVVWPGDEAAYMKVAGNHAGRLRFIPQPEPLGYGHAVHCARDFVGDEPFLHLVGDHIYVSGGDKGCAEHLVEVAAQENCSVSGVQITRESQLPYYGAVGGERLPGKTPLYRISTVAEKPSPTLAEQTLVVPGLRAGHYLCFFGMHVLTPTVMAILGDKLARPASDRASLSAALGELAAREKYLALEQSGRRFNVGTKYGMLSAQVALALAGRDRFEVLSSLLDLVAAAGTDPRERDAG
jgi:UTP--glucose-1-phosphate uridylyltransferase